MIDTNESAAGWRRLAHPLFRQTEKILRWNSGSLEAPPIIILGAPRSGTTLFYQAITAAFRMSYFCNYAAAHIRWPFFSTLLVARGIKSHETSFSNRFGFTKGKSGQSEARDLWSTWFGYDVCDETVDRDLVEICRRTVASVAERLDAPFVTKNPDHCIRIRALHATFPNAIYIRVKRDPIEIARSLLNARMDYSGTFEKWFAIRPPEVPENSELSATDQVARQVYFLEKRVDTDFEQVIPAENQLVVHYDEFCKNPSQQLERVAKIAANRGLKLERRPIDMESFSLSKGQPLPGDMEDALRRSFDNLPKRTAVDESRPSPN